MFEQLASEHTEGRNACEHSWIEGLRNPHDPARMVGPALLEESIRDYSALVGYAVVSVTIVAFSIFGGLKHNRPYVRFFLITFWAIVAAAGC